jgi:hypothetical protein
MNGGPDDPYQVPGTVVPSAVQVTSIFPIPHILAMPNLDDEDEFEGMNEIDQLILAMKEQNLQAQRTRIEYKLPSSWPTL